MRRPRPPAEGGSAGADAADDAGLAGTLGAGFAPWRLRLQHREVSGGERQGLRRCGGHERGQHRRFR